MASAGILYTELVPILNKALLQREMTTGIVNPSKMAGRQAGKTISEEMRPGLRTIETDAAAIGTRAGTNLGNGVTQGADGRLRDAHGKFVKSGEELGGAVSGGMATGTRAGAKGVSEASNVMRNEAEKSRGVFRTMATGVGGSMRAVGTSFGLPIAGMSKMGLGVAGLAAGVGIAVGASVKMAGNFQETTTTLVTGAGEQEKSLGMVRNALLDMSGQVGISANDLAKGLYLIESAGFHGAAGLNILRIAEEGAKVGGADAETVANAVTSALKAYHQPAADAAQVTNTLIATVAHGKTHMQDLSASLGNILPLASSLHIRLSEVGGAMATMTGQGTNATKAATGLRFLLMNMVHPTIAATGNMQDLGVSSQHLGDVLTHQGLNAALTVLTDAAGKKFPPGSAAYVRAMAGMVGGTRGMTAALELSNKNAPTFRKNTLDIGKAAGDTSGKVHGWNLVQKDFNQRWAEARSAIGAFVIRVGSLLLPVFTKMMTGIKDLVTWLSGHLTPAIKDVGKVLGPVLSGIGSLFGSGSKAPKKGANESQMPTQPGQHTSAGIAFAAPDNSPFRKMLNDIKGIFNQYVALVKSVVKIVRDIWKAHGKAIVADVMNAYHSMAETVKTILGVIVAVIHSRFGQQVVNFIIQVWSHIVQVIRGALLVIRGVVNLFAGLFTGNWSRLWNGVKQIAAGVWRIIWSGIKFYWNAIMLVIHAGLTVLRKLWDAAWAGIAWVLRTTWNIMRTGALQAWHAIDGGLRTGFGAFEGFFKRIWHDVENFFVGIWNAIVRFAKRIWHDVSSFYAAVFRDYVGLWKRIWHDVSSFFSDVWRGIVAFAKRIWHDISSFFATAWRNEVAFWKGIWHDISSVFSTVWNGIKRTAVSLWGDIKGFFKTAFSDFERFWDSVWNGIKKKFSDIWGGIKTIAHDVWAGIKFAVQTGVNLIIGVINDFIGALQIIPFVDKVLHKIHPISITGHGAGGGVLPGYQPGVDSVPYMLSPGEGVLVPEAVRGLGPGWVDQTNRMYSGRSNQPMSGGLSYAAAGHAPGLINQGRKAHGEKPLSHDQLRKQLGTALARPNIKPGSFMSLFVGPLKAIADAAMSGLHLPSLFTKIFDAAMNALMGDTKKAVTELLSGGGTNPKREAVIAFAEKFIGTPYVWGGSEPGGFDCSGLTSFVLDHFHINTPRTAHEQQKWAPKESKSAAAPADLAFWGNPAHHVAFWLGNNRILQAPHTGANVEISSVNQGSDFAGFGRVTALGGPASMAGGGAIGVGGGRPGANRALGQRIAAAQGVDFSALDYIFSHESGWNNFAQSPISTAFGIGQFLDGTWPQYGGKTTDPARQIEDAIKYMNDRYGGPDGAEAYWRVHHNYDRGGNLPVGMSMVFNGTGKEETVLPPAESAILHQLAGSSSGGGGHFTGTLVLSSGEFLGAVDGRIERASLDESRKLRYGRNVNP